MSTVKIENIKREDECFCCSNKEYLFSLLEPYNVEENVEIYSTMIAECFQIELSSYVEEYDRHLYLICRNCVFRLKDAFMLRSQIQIAYDRLQAERCINDAHGVIETKEHILDYNISECDNVKREDECCCCFSKDNLFSLLEPYSFEENVEIYSAIIVECFQIESRLHIEECNSCLICKNCVFRLRDAILLRSQIRTAYDRLQAKRCIKSEHSDVIDTKQHIIKYDISEYDEHYFRSCAANDNVAKLKHVKIVLENIDSNTIQNVSIVSAYVGSVGKSKRSKTFVCNICNRLFRSVSAVRRHTKLHRNTARKSCKFCKKAFKTKQKLSRHVETHSDLICDHCGKRFNRKQEYDEHILLHVGVKDVKCDLCDECFVSVKTLAKHKRIKHLDDDAHTLFCNICDKSFKNSRTMQYHKRLYHSATKKTCNFCNRIFSSNQNLMLHEKIHLNVKDFVCDYCKKAFRKKIALSKHIAFHMGVKNVKCDLCNEYFLSKRALRSHSSRLHRNRTEHACNFCKKSFTSRQSLLRHEKAHKDLICSHCNEAFRRKDALKHHILLHVGVKKVKCDLCDKSYTSTNSLRQHCMRVHFNTTEHACKYCNKTFTAKHSLLDHEKIHLDVKDVICDFCKRAFRQKSSLKDHILLHMGVKNIKCDLCDEYFVTSSALARHKRKCHSVNLHRHTCKYCYKEYANKYSLLEHEKRHLDIRDFTCDHCKKRFRDKSTMKVHILLHMGVKKFKCDLCDKFFVCKSTVNNHKRTFHFVSLPCSFCGEHFNRKLDLNKHLKMHTVKV